MLESFVTKTRDKAAALGFIKNTMKNHGSTDPIVTDGLRSYGAAHLPISAADRQVSGRKASMCKSSAMPVVRPAK